MRREKLARTVRHWMRLRNFSFSLKHWNLVHVSKPVKVVINLSYASKGNRYSSTKDKAVYNFVEVNIARMRGFLYI